MKKVFSLKKHLVEFVCTVVFCAVFCATILGFSNNKKINEIEVVNAYKSADVTQIVSDLSSDNSYLEATYSLLDFYPVMPENQTTSELCWIYSSMKALETSIMVQANEYYNFSEVATAYVAYKYGLRSSINSTGVYQDFIDTALVYGLVHEAEFSNGHYFDIDEQNQSYYDYVIEKLDKSIIKNVKTVQFEKNSDYKNLVYDNKLEFIKRYIKKYGGLFAGLNAGVIYSSGINIYENNPNKPGDDSYAYIRNSHAVCLVGWNDAYGFLAVNSWGVEEPNSYQTFYIPYNYVDMHDTVNGFIYESNNEKIATTESSASEFASTIIGGDKKLNNVFCYGENLSLGYLVSDDVGFENVYVDIYKGEELVTKNFNLTYNDADRSVKLALKRNYSGFVGGTYIVKFFEDKTFVGSKNFYVFTGTEVSYFKLTKTDRNETTECEILMNSFVNSINSETYYISSLDSYKLYFYLTPLNKWASTKNSLEFGVGPLYKYVYDNGQYKKEATGETFVYEDGDLKDLSNCYVVNIPALIEYTNNKLEFEITIYSTVYPQLSRNYVITLFASSNANTNTADAKIVHYDLGGGLNSSHNPKRLPVLGRETSVQRFELFEPTKIGYDFIGWFRNKDFTGSEVTYLNGVAEQDIYLYAAWKQDTTNYFETSFLVKNVYDYYGKLKITSNELVYGDKIKLGYDFTVLDELNRYNFSSVYYVYINNNQVERANLGKVSKSFDFEFDINTLKAGKYVISITSVVVVSHSLSITNTKSLNINVKPKAISFEFGQLDVVYNAKNNTPEVVVGQDAFYQEDLQGVQPKDMFIFSNVKAKDVGKYKFEIVGLKNENYVINGTKECVLTVLPKGLIIEWVELSKIYNGEVQHPEFSVYGIEDGDEVLVTLNANAFKNAGKYTVNTNIIKINNNNYSVSGENNEQFIILPAPLTVKINDVKERIQISPSYRKRPTYVIEGLLYDSEQSLNIKINSEALNIEKSGVYEITGTYNNSNYEITFENATYILSGEYMVTYKLPNGEKYVEYVEEGHDPKGIDNSIYKKPLFAKIEYSEPLVNNYEDMYIDVVETDYTWIVFALSVVFGFIVIYLLMTRKARRNKVS